MMKKYFSIILLTIILSGALHTSFAEAKEYTELYDENKCTSGEMTDADLAGYKVYEGKVYYFYCLIEDMDPQTIKPLVIDGRRSITYAQDNKNVYFKTRILKGLKPNLFKIKSFTDNPFIFLYDKDTIYLNGMDITDSSLDIESFQPLGNYYYRDKNSLYLQIMTDITPSQIENFTFEKIAGANPDNFSLGYKIATDAVYWYGKKIEEADIGSFELINLGFAKDKNNIFFNGKIVYGADTKSFTETTAGDVNYYVDKNGFFGDDDGKHYLTISYMDKKYPKDRKTIQQSLSTAIKTYETRYPNYNPRPAVPEPGSPEGQELKKFEAEVAKAKLEESEVNKQNMIKMGIMGISGALGLGGAVYGFIKLMNRGKK